MCHKSKMEYLKTIYQRYHRSSTEDKTHILNEFTQVCGYHRKYALRLLNAPPPSGKSKQRKKRDYVYNTTVISVLEAIWEASGYLWSQRLKAALPLWLPWAKKRFNLTPQCEKSLLSISPATIDRRLKPYKLRIKKKIYGTTRPGTLLKHHIPIKTDSWDVTTPGFLEVDLVSHSGSSADGEFIHTLDCVDIHTTWSERRAVLGKGQTMVVQSFEEIKGALPFTLKGIDSDNDSSFINYHLYALCDKHNIQFTRGRPYKKDDNAHIEQKNWTHVRKIFGYVRYDSQDALHAMNDLYRDELRWFQNLFQPSVKLLKKVRVGSRLTRVYDAPKTPFQRVCECQEVDLEKVSQLKTLLHSLDPFKLSLKIEEKLDRIHQMADKPGIFQRTGINNYSQLINKREKEPKREKQNQKPLRVRLHSYMI